jgi:hypothetical protein
MWSIDWTNIICTVSSGGYLIKYFILQKQKPTVMLFTDWWIFIQSTITVEQAAHSGLCSVAIFDSQIVEEIDEFLR